MNVRVESYTSGMNVYRTPVNHTPPFTQTLVVLSVTRNLYSGIMQSKYCRGETSGETVSFFPGKTDTRVFQEKKKSLHPAV